jgi:putative sugar O-methyltransferase
VTTAPKASVASGASKFWQELSAAHMRDLERFGFDNIKRRQAFKYFNWSWRWAALRQSEQFRFLLRHAGPVTLLRAALSPPVLDDAAWSATTLSRPDRWLYTTATRMLWDYARRHGDAEVIALPEPAQGAPLPVYWTGRLISQDLANTALEVHAIRRALGGKRVTRALEVGAGYGRTAYAILSLYPECSYTIVDIEPALSISRWYLSQLFDPSRLRFIAAENATPSGIGSADLAISISSLQEMTQDQIRQYLEMFDVVASGGVVFLKQWADWHNAVDNIAATFADYPFPTRWDPLLWQPAPVQTRFIQAAWRVPTS